MGYLNKTTQVLDAILTTKGRELLAKGDGSFNITKFALGDDEIDYTDENRANTPILEPTPNSNQAMKTKLVSFDVGTTSVVEIFLSSYTYTLSRNQFVKIEPTLTYGVAQKGYLFEFKDLSGITVERIDANGNVMSGSNITPDGDINKEAISSSFTSHGIKITSTSIRNMTKIFTITELESGRPKNVTLILSNAPTSEV